MPSPVSLQAVIEEMDSQNEMIEGFINCKTGELAILTEDDRYTLQRLDEGGDLDELPEWQQEIVPKLREVADEDGDFIPLPSQFDIHEYRIMENFIHSLENGPMKDELFDAIRGRGAFRRFGDKVFYYNIRDDWFRFKNNVLKEIAINFLESEGIPYTDDVK